MGETNESLDTYRASDRKNEPLQVAFHHHAAQRRESFADPHDRTTLAQRELAALARVWIERKTQHRALLRFRINDDVQERGDDCVESTRNIRRRLLGKQRPTLDLRIGANQQPTLL